MATPWAQVAASPQYRALPPEQQEAARQQYFDQVVAPQIGDPSQIEIARAQFDAQAKPQEWQPKKRSLSDIRKEGKGFDPTEGQGFVKNAVQGFGQSFVNTGRGVSQLFGGASEQDVQRAREIDAPLMDTGGGMLGNIAGQATQIALPIPGAAAAKATSWAGKGAQYVGAAARSGAFGAAQGVEDGESRLQNGGVNALFGAGGQAVANGGSALARGAISRLDNVTKGLAQTAVGNNIKLGLAELSSNPLVRTATSQLERLPFSGSSRRLRDNAEQFTKLVGGEFGAAEKRITPDVFAKAKTALSNKFEALSSRNDLMPSTQLVAEMKQVLDEATRLGGSDTARMVKGWTDELISKVDANGVIPGKAYQSFDSRLGKVLKSGGEPSHYLGMLRESVRSAMDKSISPADQAAWRAVRQQWAAMKAVEPLVAKSVDGLIPPAQLMGRVTADGVGKSRMAGSTTALGELAKIGQRFLKDAPNSGTADRALVNLGVGGGLIGLQQGGVISPETALYTGAGLLGNRAALKAINSKGVTVGGSKTLNGLSKLMGTAPRLLPAAASSALGINISGGRKATQEDMERDAEIVRRYRQQQGR